MRGCKKRRNGLSEEAAGCRGCTRDASEARSGPDGGTLVGGPRPGCKHTCIFVLDNLLCPSLKRPFLSFFLSLCNWNEVIILKNGEQWGNDSNAEWTEVKLFFLEEWDELFSSRIYFPLLQWARGQHCIEIQTKGEAEKLRSGSAYALCPTPSDRLTFITLLVISCSTLCANSVNPSGSCGGGGGGGGGGVRGEDGPGIDLPDIFCSLGSLIAEGRLPR